MKSKKPIMLPKRNIKTTATCANCGKQYEDSDYSTLCDFILKNKPACSYECNKALGQIAT